MFVGKEAKIGFRFVGIEKVSWNWYFAQLIECCPNILFWMEWSHYRNLFYFPSTLWPIQSGVSFECLTVLIKKWQNMVKNKRSVGCAFMKRLERNGADMGKTKTLASAIWCLYNIGNWDHIFIIFWHTAMRYYRIFRDREIAGDYQGYCWNIFLVELILTQVICILFYLKW